MPTQQVEPSSDARLQDVANALLKARKVVVVTGAGISTNSGIPDFRSENGLYSLIQTQFDNATRQNRQQDLSDSSTRSQSDIDEREDGQRAKRRRLSRESGVDTTTANTQDVKDEIEVCADTITVHPPPPRKASNTDAPDKAEDTASLPDLEETAFCTPKPIRTAISAAMPTTSPLSSPPAELVPPSAFRSCSRNRFLDLALPMSSSPLSSPPPVLFDPFASSSPSDTSPSQRSGTPQSELDDSLASNPFSSSQTSNVGRSSLPNMKGKDLFDASIWADPLRTSVFYTFATSLRQKIRDCEPTSSHHFISHLRDRGKLVRCYTQNIDRIEEKVGLSTSLQDGPGSRGRFSRRSTANTSQPSKMVEEDSNDTQGTEGSEPAASRSSQAVRNGHGGASTPTTEDDTPSEEQQKPVRPPKLEPSRSSGVECVFLHGSLESLRCFLCGRATSWDDAREYETLSGQQPECPHCIGATVAREERGKRALGVGKLRPDIVLYGEEHPNAHLISPIVTNDLALCPDMLLILGTSLRVHGLKVLVREFAKAIHNRGGKVVFVNFTKPPESSWGDVIDYWVQWDCDAWVADLQNRVPRLWEAPQPPKKKKTEEEKEKEKRERPPPANPVALRDTKVAGAYWTLKIRNELYRITGTPSLAWEASRPEAQKSADASKESKSDTAELASGHVQEAITVKTQLESTAETNQVQSVVEATVDIAEKPNFAQKTTKARPKRWRKSAPGAVERPKKQPSSTLNPDHGRARRSQPPAPPATPENGPHGQLLSSPRDPRTAISSILNSVKERPRIRKRKKIDGEEVALPCSKSRKSEPEVTTPEEPQLTLAPLTNQEPPTPPQLDLRPRPLEPESSPLGPMARFRSRLQSAWEAGLQNAAYYESYLNVRHSWFGPLRATPSQQEHGRLAQREQGFLEHEKAAAVALAGMAAPKELMR